MNEEARPATLLPDWRGWLFVGVIALATAAILLAMGRTPICECGTVELWHGMVRSAGNSQHLADWYSLSHVIHGMLFYALARLLWRMFGAVGGHPAVWALPAAVAFEGLWELLENSPMIIERYRATTVSFGYSGDSVINSLADIGWMVLGFLLASSLPASTGLILVVGFELATLALIRDNLTLNVVMLVWPIESVREWQAAEPGLAAMFTGEAGWDETGQVDPDWEQPEPYDADWAETDP